MKGLLFVALLLASAGGFAFHEHKNAAKEAAALGVVATQLSGRPAHVHCQSLAAAALDVTAEDGSVTFDSQGNPGDTAHLNRNTCRSLGRFRADANAGKLGCLASPDTCSAGILGEAEAVHVLTHESMHLRGLRDEAQAECIALAATTWTATQLGATADDAGLVAKYARERLYPMLPTEYPSAACGG